MKRKYRKEDVLNLLLNIIEVVSKNEFNSTLAECISKTSSLNNSLFININIILDPEH